MRAAGLSPNRRGVFSDGRSLGGALQQHRRDTGRPGAAAPALTATQARAAMLLLQEVRARRCLRFLYVAVAWHVVLNTYLQIASERLFSIVREER